MTDQGADIVIRYPNLQIERGGNGVLTLVMHTAGGAPVFTGSFYEQLADAWIAIGEDEATRAVLWTARGGEWLARRAAGDGKPNPFELSTRAGADRLDRAQRKLLGALFAVETPIVAAVPGPAALHPEFLLAPT